MLMWFSYISSRQTLRDIKDRYDDTSEGKTWDNPRRVVVQSPKFFMNSCRRYKTTILRAPMAHKTYSQEQFSVQYFKFSVSFRFDITGYAMDEGRHGHVDKIHISSINESLFFINFLLSTMPHVNTNLLILQSYVIVFHAYDEGYFQFCAFLTFEYYRSKSDESH
jgi:hypothetical protein